MVVMDSTYSIGGMSCQHCVMHIKQEVAKIPGVTSVALDLDDAQLVIESDDQIDFDLVQSAVEEAGD